MFYNFARWRQHHLLSLPLWRRRLIFWLGSILVGLIAVGFARIAAGLDNWFRTVVWSRQIIALFAVPIGMSLLAAATSRWISAASGSGIPQVIAALGQSVSARKRLIALPVAAAKLLLTCLGLMCGASIGREGPTVQIGASLMQSLGSVGGFSRFELEKGLLLSGAAAGLAAAFNTPIAGIVFAIEELSRSFEQSLSGTILTAVIISGLVAQAFTGNYAYLGVFNPQMSTEDVLLVVVLTGIIGGLCGGCFALLLIRGTKIIRRLLMPIWLRALICGLLVMLIAQWSHGHTLGSGYHETELLLSASESKISIWYGVHKFLATLISYFSGIPGGIFAPTLSAGAGFGHLLAHYIPIGNDQMFVLCTMVAYFAGVLQAPMTTFIIMSEMTNGQTWILPMMATSLLAAGIGRLMVTKPLYVVLSEFWLASTHNARETKLAS